MSPPALKRRKLSHTPSSGSDSDTAPNLRAPNGLSRYTAKSTENTNDGSSSSDDGETTRSARVAPEMIIEEEYDEDDDTEDSEASEYAEAGEDSLESEDDEQKEEESRMDEADEEEKRRPNSDVELLGQDVQEAPATAKPSRDDVASPLRGKPGPGAQNPLLDETVYTSEMFKSNVFKLQVDNLLQREKPKQVYDSVALEKLLRTIKSLIENIPDVPACTIAEAEKSLHKSSRTVIPFPDPRPPKDVKYKLEYRRPTNIKVIGSFATKTMTKTGEAEAVDVAITMPSSIFQEKDYLNYRYIYKRAYYLARLADALCSNKEHPARIAYNFLHGNDLQPILVIDNIQLEKVDGQTTCKINIIPCYPAGLFPKDKLAPIKNCIRPKQESEGAATQKLLPTPFYNASICMDGATMHFLKTIHRASVMADGFSDACMLGRVWLHQRGITMTIGDHGFGNFEFTAIMAVLLQSDDIKGAGSLSPGYSSYQLFKATLQFLAQRDLSRHPFHSADGTSTSLKADACPQFFDAEAGLNMLFRMTPWSYALLRHEAGQAVATLGESNTSQFETTFAQDTSAAAFRYDSLIRLSLYELGIDPSSPRDRTTHLSKTHHKLYTYLNRALGDRITLLNLSTPLSSSWPTDSKPPSTMSSHVSISLLHDPQNISRTLDKGPSATSKAEAASFRAFWGPKSELRRFKDGSIVETLEWSPKDPTSTILQQIVTHTLSRHFRPEAAASAKFHFESLATLLPEVSGGAYTSIAPFKPAMNAFQTLEKDLRGLDGLPLQFRHILAASPQLSYTSLHVPSRHISTAPADVVIEFEGSSRWPSDLPAIQRTKGAFLLKISESLEAQHSTLVTRLGLENTTSPLQNQCFLDITYPSPPTFRLRIRLDHETTLLTRALKSPLLSPSQKESHALALHTHKRILHATPLHTQSLITLCTRLPALSPAIRLTTKWFASHLLLPHIPLPLVSLLVLHAFLSPSPFSTPSSPQSAFFRTLLHLASWAWRTEPLILDISGSLSADARTAIHTRFQAWRTLDPAMTRVVLFAASSLEADGDGAVFTEYARPSKVVAGRMSGLARAAVHAIRTQDLDLDVRSLFVSGLGDYDFLLHLDRRFAGSRRNEDGREGAKGTARDQQQQFKNLQIQGVSGKEARMIGYDPAGLLFEELQRVYGHIAVFFYNPDGGKVMAGLWNPGSTATRAWKVRMGYSTVPVTKDGSAEQVDAVLNKQGMLAEMARLGGDIIERVEEVKG